MTIYMRNACPFFLPSFFKLYINFQTTAFSLTKGFMGCGWEWGKESSNPRHHHRHRHHYQLIRKDKKKKNGGGVLEDWG